MSWVVGELWVEELDGYGAGHSEKLIGRTFAGRREEIVISSKVGNRVTEEGEWRKDLSPDWIR